MHFIRAQYPFYVYGVYYLMSSTSQFHILHDNNNIINIYNNN